MKGELVMVTAEERGILWVAELIHKCTVQVYLSLAAVFQLLFFNSFYANDLVCEAKPKFEGKKCNILPPNKSPKQEYMGQKKKRRRKKKERKKEGLQHMNPTYKCHAIHLHAH